MAWLWVGLGLAGILAGMALLARTLSGLGRVLQRAGPRTPAPAAMLAGAAAAALLQSSSLCVAGIAAAADGGLGLAQAWAAAAGANVGGTLLPHLTAWSPSWAVLLVAAAVGATALLHARLRRGGGLVLAVALLSAGFRLISGGAGAGWPVAAGALRAAAAPPAAFLAGLVLAAVLFSSGFTIAVAQGLAAAGSLPLAAGIAFVCGANIGTTSDVLFAALATGRRGRITAGFHLCFKVLCACGGLLLMRSLAGWARALNVPPARALAQVNTGLNLAAALVLLPFLPWLARGAAHRAAGARGGPGIRR